MPNVCYLPRPYCFSFNAIFKALKKAFRFLFQIFCIMLHRIKFDLIEKQRIPQNTYPLQGMVACRYEGCKSDGWRMKIAGVMVAGVKVAGLAVVVGGTRRQWSARVLLMSAAVAWAAGGVGVAAQAMS
jgi:hypothetical protein